jgi:hypothetical protein
MRLAARSEDSGQRRTKTAGMKDTSGPRTGHIGGEGRAAADDGQDAAAQGGAHEVKGRRQAASDGLTQHGEPLRGQCAAERANTGRSPAKGRVAG